MIKLCDVHVIIHPNRNHPADLLNMLTRDPPINVYPIQGSLGNTALSRAEGFRSGTCPYISFVDDDDAVKPGIFQRCVNELQNDLSLDGVVTLEKVRKGGRVFYTPELIGDIFQPHHLYLMHHVIVVRRQVMYDFLHVFEKSKGFSEFTCWAAMLLEGCKFKQIKEVGYEWFDEGSTKKLNIPVTDYTRELVNRCVRSTGKVMAEGVKQDAY